MEFKAMRTGIGTNISAALLVAFLAIPAGAADFVTGTFSNQRQLQATAFRFDSTLMTSQSDPHHIELTDLPAFLNLSTANNQFGNGLPSGFSQAGFLDVNNSSGVGELQSVVSRMTMTAASPSGRVRQLQLAINQSQLAAGYQFNDQFGITATSDAGGNLTGEAEGKFIMTQTSLVSPGVVAKTVCQGTFTYSSNNGFVLTSGVASQSFTGTGCVTQ